jgi:hypothetical protein
MTIAAGLAGRIHEDIQETGFGNGAGGDRHGGISDVERA